MLHGFDVIPQKNKIMKKIMLVAAALFIHLGVISQGIEFQKGRYADVLKMAKKQNKLVFVDVYTSWCGPCKHMAKTIFPEAEAGEFFNAHFLNLQLDAEKSEDGKSVAKEFGVNAFPTFLFINGEGELVYRFLGGRTLEMFVEEGRKAVEAFQARPELQKYAKKYDKGQRDKAFLERYFLLKDKAGLDCSDVLTDYFTQLDDVQLVDSVNAPRIAKITVYQPELADRIVEAVCKEAARADKNKKQFSTLNKAVCTYLGACLKDVAQQENEVPFDAVLALKDRLFKATGNRESVTTASLGGGNVYIPSELLRMNYYAARKKSELFFRTFQDYMKVLQKKYEETFPEKEKMQQAMEEKMKAAKERGDEEEYESVKKMNAMMSAFSSIDDYYISTSMVENVERYEELYAGEKNEAYQEQVAGWYVFLHRLSPSAKTAVYVAGKLMELGRKQQAVEVLALGLEKGEKAPGVEEEDVRVCREKWEEWSK